MKPLVTILIPSYNYGHFLGQTLASVQAQTHTDWECIVVDDGSTDDTWDVAMTHAQADERIKYVRRGNGGLAAARNTGIVASTGDYLQFLDADDLIEPRKLEVQVGYLSQHPEAGIVYGDVRYFDTDKPHALRHSLFDDDPWMTQVSGAGESVLRTLISRNIMVVNSPLVRRALIDRVGGFDESLASLEDWDYWIRCAASGAHFRYLDVEGTRALVRVHRKSMSQDRLRMRQQEVVVRKSLRPSLAGEEIYLQNRWLLSEELGALGLDLIRQGNRLGGAQCALEATFTGPGLRSAKWVKEALFALLSPRRA